MPDIELSTIIRGLRDSSLSGVGRSDVKTGTGIN